MIKGTVTKVQSYSTGNDCSLAIVSDDKDKVMQYDKEVVFIYSEAENNQNGENPLIKINSLLEYIKTVNLALLDMSKELEELKSRLEG